MIECDSHGQVDGYIVCRHVARGGARCTHYRAPSSGGAHPSDDLGEALCAPCASRITKLNVNDLMLVCESCLQKIIAELGARH